MLRACNASFSFGENVIYDDINFNVRKGDILCLLGKNGCGKSTLINCIAKYYSTHNSIFYKDKSIEKYNYKEYAKFVSTVSQNNYVDCNFNALTVVIMGRTPYISHWGQPSEQDINIARHYMSYLKIDHLEKRYFSSLSIGQQKMVLIAQSLAKETPIIIFDEPTAPLDLHNKILLLTLLKTIALQDRIILFSTHDPNDALALSTKVILFSNHKVLCGDTLEILTSENISSAYDINAELVTANNRKFFIYGGT